MEWKFLWESEVILIVRERQAKYFQGEYENLYQTEELTGSDIEV